MNMEYCREAILSGSVDMFCLACEEHLRCERDAGAHVAAPRHRDNLRALGYVGAYRGERIRKIKKGYFCEFCNRLLATASKVDLHVAETLHMENKGSMLIERVGASVIALGYISISERAWHGLTENTCEICSVEYDSEDIHKNQATHIIQLIQSEVKYGANNSVYRLIDDDSFQCLTCNVVRSLTTINEHFNSSDHQTIFSECLVSNKMEHINDHIVNKHEEQTDIPEPEMTDDINNVTQDLKEKLNIHKEINNFQVIQEPEIGHNKYETAHNEITNDKNRNNILDAINKIQRNEINIDFETQSVFCKRCLLALDFNCSVIEQHIQEHAHKPRTTAKLPLSYPVASQNHIKMSLPPCDEPPSDHKTDENYEPNTRKYNLKALPGINDVKPKKGNENDANKIPLASSSSDHLRDMEPSGSQVTEDPTDDANSYAKKHQLTYSENSRQAYCRICEARLPATLTSMKEHVAGSAHKIRTANSKPNKTKSINRKTNNIIKESTPTNIFIEECLVVKAFEATHSVIINREYMLDVMSYMLMTLHDFRWRCQVCEVNIINSERDEHINSYEHKNALTKVPVITSLSSEFIREVRPGLFHCGYCHLLLSDWDNICNHVKCSEHKTRKTLAKYRLMTNLREMEEEERIKRFVFYQMFRNNFY